MTQEQERLIERLLRRKGGWTSNITYKDDAGDLINPNGPEAATELRRSYAECDALRAALEPFARMTFEGTMWERPQHVNEPVMLNHASGAKVTVTDFDRARTLHQSKESGNVG